VVAIKALACELPSRRALPLARWSVAELRQEAVASGLVAKISGTTLWRWLGQDALRPWRHRSWIFPRDSQFARKAGRVIDLYQRRWKGAALGPRDYVLCVDISDSRAVAPRPPAAELGSARGLAGSDMTLRVVSSGDGRAVAIRDHILPLLRADGALEVQRDTVRVV
jgi:hypothetical protein